MIQKTVFFLIFFLCAASFAPFLSHAETDKAAFRSTNYPLPRYVSLRSDEVYVRSGPGRKFPVQWIFKKKDLPVEITLEYDVWRKIKDFDGHEGWVHKSLLSGKRTGLVQSEENVTIYKKSNESSSIQAYLEPEVLVEIDQCDTQWCKINAAGYKGWVQQTLIWGVYEHEEFD